MMYDAETIYTYLASLGDDADAVARTLKGMGIKGHRFGDDGPCPLGQALTWEFGMVGRTGICQAFAYVGDVECTPVPPSCDAFMQAFDGLKYRELLEEGAA